MMAALTLALLVGFPVARRADRDAPLLRLLGESFLLGIGICALTLFAISVCGARWSVLLALLILLVVAYGPALAGRPAKGGPHTRFHLIDLLTLATVVGYALFATIAPPVEIDFIANWGLKARIFSLHGGIDWDFLQNAWYRWDHPDYPPLLPLTFDWMTLFAREWSPQWLGILYPALGLALLAIMRSLFADEFASPLLASLVRGRTAESITLSTRATIEIHTNSFRAVRGYSIALAVCDELSFWEGDDSARPNTRA